MSQLQFPGMRQELVQYLMSLSDIDYQRRAWAGRSSEKKMKYDEMNYAIHFFYDDTKLASNPDLTIGVILHNHDEVKFIKDLTIALDLVFSKYGTTLQDAEYIETAEWKGVVDSAARALSCIQGT